MKNSVPGAASLARRPRWKSGIEGRSLRSLLSTRMVRVARGASAAAAQAVAARSRSVTTARNTAQLWRARTGT